MKGSNYLKNYILRANKLKYLVWYFVFRRAQGHRSRALGYQYCHIRFDLANDGMIFLKTPLSQGLVSGLTGLWFESLAAILPEKRLCLSTAGEMFTWFGATAPLA